MKTIIDIGNTNIKIITKKNTTYIKNFKNQETILNLNKFVISNKIEDVLLVNVGLSSTLIKKIKVKYELFDNKNVLNYVKFNFDISSFGSDRLVNMICFKKTFNFDNYLIFDFGTYLTLDIITNNCYEDGLILFGITSQLKQILTNAQKINLKIEDVLNAKKQISTQSQIKYGLINQIKALISFYENKYPNHQILITGHDLDFVEVNKNWIVEPNLLKYLI